MGQELLRLQNGSDVRGVAIAAEQEDITLSKENAYAIARSFGRWVKKQSPNKKEKYVATVGMDSRLSGPMLKGAVMYGLAAEGFHVYDAALSSTPAIFMSTVFEEIQADCGVMITASHLPANRNGMKFFTRAGGTNKQDIREILLDAEQTPIERKTCNIFPLNLTKRYADHLTSIIREQTGKKYPFTGCKMIVDAGGGAGGFFAEILNELGADTSGSLFLEPDGTFSGHIPNPENATVLADFSRQVKEQQAELGIIFDTDVDRAAVVDKGGHIIARNALIALMTLIVLKDSKQKPTIVTDSVTSSSLKEFIEKKGAVHHRFKRGYKNVIDEAIRLNATGVYAPLAIETSGHGALMENYFLDDGAYMAVKILILYASLMEEGKSLSDLLKDFEEAKEAEELRMYIECEDFQTCGNRALEAFADYAQKQSGWKIETPNYEGVRIQADEQSGEGWALMRLSLHDPEMVINIESRQNGGVAKIKEHIFEALKPFEDIRQKTK